MLYEIFLPAGLQLKYLLISKANWILLHVFSSLAVAAS